MVINFCSQKKLLPLKSNNIFLLKRINRMLLQMKSFNKYVQLQFKIHYAQIFIIIFSEMRILQARVQWTLFMAKWIFAQLIIHFTFGFHFKYASVLDFSFMARAITTAKMLVLKRKFVLATLLCPPPPMIPPFENRNTCKNESYATLYHRTSWS